MCHTVHVYFCKQLQLAAVTISIICDTVSCNLQEEKYHKYWRTAIKIKRRTDINQDIFIPQGWMISAQTTQLDLQQTFNGKLYLVVGQTNGIVTVSDVKVERDAPHDDQSHVDLHQLPADRTARPHHGVCVLHHHHLPGGLSRIVDHLILCSATTCIREKRFVEEILSWWCRTLCWSQHPGG